MHIPRLHSLDDIYLEFIAKWNAIPRPYGIDEDVRHAIDDAYEVGFQDGRGEGLQAASDYE